MSLAIVGDTQTGKSTFIGLLYQTMVRVTNDPVTQGTFYYTWSNRSGKNIQNIYHKMIGGKATFPSPTPLTTFEREMSLLLGFKPRRGEQLLPLIKERLVNAGNFQNVICTTLNMMDLSGELIKQHYSDPKRQKSIQALFDSPIQVFVIDCSKFTNEGIGKKYVTMDRYHQDLTNMMSSFTQYRRDKETKPAMITLLMKADAMDNDIKKQFGVDKLISKSIDKKGSTEILQEYKRNKGLRLKSGFEGMKNEANKIGDDLIREYLPDFRGLLLSTKIADVDVEPLFLPSWVLPNNPNDPKDKSLKKDRFPYTDNNQKNRHTIMTNVYSWHIYVILLEHIRNLVKLSADRQEDIESVFGEKWYQNSNPTVPVPPTT